MQLVKPTELSTKAKAIAATLISLIGLVQVDFVRNKILPLVDHHPHVASILGGLLTLAAFLQNPVGKKALGYLGFSQEQQVVDTPAGQALAVTTTEVVPLPPNTTGEGTISTTTKQEPTS